MIKNLLCKTNALNSLRYVTMEPKILSPNRIPTLTLALSPALTPALTPTLTQTLTPTLTLSE